VSVSTALHSTHHTAFYAEYGCMDAFNAALPSWNLDFKQDSPGEFKSALALAQTQDLIINRISMNQPARQQGAAPEGMVSFGLLSERSPGMNWCGIDISSSTLERFDAGAAFSCRSGRGFDVTTISVNEALLSSLAEAEELTVGAKNSPLSFNCDWRALKTIRLSVQQIFQQLNGDAGPAQRRAILDGLCADLSMQLLLAGSSPIHTRRPSGQSRRRARERAIEYMHANVRSNPAIGRMCEIIGCSWRLLNYAFKECYGMGPKAYLLMLRLDGLRGDLLAADHHETVTTIATRWGFTHFGQLGRDYKKLFGELPSQALRSRF
jgi:AraC family ethanolamine operon transcriptional activator